MRTVAIFGLLAAGCVVSVPATASEKIERLRATGYILSGQAQALNGEYSYYFADLAGEEFSIEIDSYRSPYAPASDNLFVTTVSFNIPTVDTYYQLLFQQEYFPPILVGGYFDSHSSVTEDAALGSTVGNIFNVGAQLNLMDFGMSGPIVRTGSNGFDVPVFYGRIGAYTLAEDYKTWSFTYVLNDVTASYFDLSAVPEPSTWAMMIGGFGMVGGAMRRRRVTAKLSVA